MLFKKLLCLAGLACAIPNVAHAGVAGVSSFIIDSFAQGDISAAAYAQSNGFPQIGVDYGDHRFGCYGPCNQSIGFSAGGASAFAFASVSAPIISMSQNELYYYVPSDYYTAVVYAPGYNTDAYANISVNSELRFSTSVYARINGGPLVPPGSFDFLFNGPSGFVTVDAVPEPTTWALMLVGFGAVGSAVRRRVRPASLAHLLG